MLFVVFHTECVPSCVSVLNPCNLRLCLSTSLIKSTYLFPLQYTTVFFFVHYSLGRNFDSY
jgi:hypothetical protein